MKKSFEELYRSFTVTQLKETAKNPDLQPLALEAVKSELKKRSEKDKPKEEKEPPPEDKKKGHS